MDGEEVSQSVQPAGLWIRFSLDKRSFEVVFVHNVM